VKVGMEQEKGPETDPLEFREAAPSAGTVGGMIGTKNLLIIIVTMPFVFLVVVMAIIGFFGNPNETSAPDEISGNDAAGVVRSIQASPAPETALDEPSANRQRVVLPMPASIRNLAPAITLPEGATPGAISLDGDRIALRVDGDAGAMIVIYDLSTDQVVKTIPLVEVTGSAMSVNPVAPLESDPAGGDDAPLQEDALQEDARVYDGVPTPRLAAHRTSNG
jgi:hypothetical protein